MSPNKQTSAAVDSLLKFIAAGGVLSLTIFAPNAVQALDKPLAGLSKKLDKRQRQREYQKYLRYMRRQGLIKLNASDYEHGIVLTAKGLNRAAKANLDDLSIPKPVKWDGKWRIVLFDIPEKHKTSRDYLSRKLKQLGMRQLQKSVWVYPYPCLKEVELVVGAYRIEKFVSYFETKHINASENLKQRFNFKF